jgi:hypothetical protein
MKQELKYALFIVLAVFIAIFSFGSTFITVGELCGHHKPPDWLVGILILPTLTLAIFIAEASVKELDRVFWGKKGD